MAWYSLLRSNNPSATAEKMHPSLSCIPSRSIVSPLPFIMYPSFIRAFILSSFHPLFLHPPFFHPSFPPGIVKALYALLRSNNPSATAPSATPKKTSHIPHAFTLRSSPSILHDLSILHSRFNPFILSRFILNPSILHFPPAP